MKKFCILLAVLFAAILAGCGADAEEIILTFDRSEAYFSGNAALVPIAGETPAVGEICDEQTVTLRASEPVRMRLILEYAEESSDIEGLRIVVGERVFSVSNGLELYLSAREETEAKVLLKFFLAKDAPESVKGKKLIFTLALCREE